MNVCRTENSAQYSLRMFCYIPMSHLSVLSSTNDAFVKRSRKQVCVYYVTKLYLVCQPFTFNSGVWANLHRTAGWGEYAPHHRNIKKKLNVSRNGKHCSTYLRFTLSRDFGHFPQDRNDVTRGHQSQTPRYPDWDRQFPKKDAFGLSSWTESARLTERNVG